MNEKILDKIIFMEKQAKWHCVDGSKEQKKWLSYAKTLRNKISEARPLYQLVALKRAYD